jgi:hypothetical protein
VPFPRTRTDLLAGEDVRLEHLLHAGLVDELARCERERHGVVEAACLEPVLGARLKVRSTRAA